MATFETHESPTNLRDALEYASEQAVAAQRPVKPEFYDEGAANVNSEIPYVVVPDGHKVVSLEAMIFHGARPRPTRIEEATGVATVDSFVEYVQRFKTAGTTIVAHLQQRRFCANLDYHENPALPSWNKHSVTMQLELSRQLGAWKANDGKPLSQGEFAEFLEDHADDVENSADLVEVARNLQATKNVTVKSSNNLANGSVAFNWTEEVNGSVNNGRTVIPQTFELRVPIFRYDTPGRVVARFRYRLGNGELRLLYTLHQLDDILEVRTQAALAIIEAATGIKALIVG